MAYHFSMKGIHMKKITCISTLAVNSASAKEAFEGFMMNGLGKPAGAVSRLLSRTRIPIAVSTYGYKTAIVWR
jgi:hypothetical protein